MRWGIQRGSAGESFTRPHGQTLLASPQYFPLHFYNYNLFLWFMTPPTDFKPWPISGGFTLGVPRWRVHVMRFSTCLTPLTDYLWTLYSLNLLQCFFVVCCFVCRPVIYFIIKLQTKIHVWQETYSHAVAVLIISKLSMQTLHWSMVFKQRSWSYRCSPQGIGTTILFSRRSMLMIFKRSQSFTECVDVVCPRCAETHCPWHNSKLFRPIVTLLMRCRVCFHTLLLNITVWTQTQRAHRAANHNRFGPSPPCDWKRPYFPPPNQSAWPSPPDHPRRPQVCQNKTEFHTPQLRGVSHTPKRDISVFLCVLFFFLPFSFSTWPTGQQTGGAKSLRRREQQEKKKREDSLAVRPPNTTAHGRNTKWLLSPTRRPVIHTLPPSTPRSGVDARGTH